MTLILWAGRVPTDAIDIVRARAERVARRANRLGFPSPSVITGDRSLARSGASSIEVTNIQVVASGPMRLGDWTFAGTVSVLADGSAFVTWVPGVERIDWSGTANHCDHCRTSRDRNNTYLVVSPAGLYHQVGSTCIKDFTGHSPAAIVGWLDAVDDLTFSDEEVGGWSRSATRFYSPVEVIGFASRVVTREGYVSKQKSEDENRQSTAEQVRSAVSGSIALFEQEFPITPESEALYFATMEAIEEAVSQPAGSDWMADIIRLASVPGVQWRHIGILASAVILGLRQQERAALANRPESNFFGGIGERLTLSGVRVVMKRAYDGAYGRSFVIRFDVGGDDAVWFAAFTEAAESLKEGDTIDLTGTVKAHEMDTRSNRPTTVLTRCAIRKG